MDFARPLFASASSQAGTRSWQSRYRQKKSLKWTIPCRRGQHAENRFASAAEDVAAAERAIQQEIDRKEENSPKSRRKEQTRNAGGRSGLS